MRSSLLFIILAASFGTANFLPAKAQDHEVEIKRDIVFAQPDGVDLLLNLHLPTGVEQAPLVMFIHGGSWRNGDRNNCKVAWLAEHGYAVASIEYRVSTEALFPAQIHDCKGALRWLRANASRYGYDATHVVVSGSSAGGHLATLMGTSAGIETLEGNTGGNLDQSSRVQGIIDYYGPTDFVKRSDNQPSKTDEPKGGVYQLLGGPVKSNLDLAKIASPVTYVSKDDPPLLIFHGSNDKTVFLDQSEFLKDAYQQKNLEVSLNIVPDAGHGWKTPAAGERAKISAFLKSIFKTE